MHAAVVYGLLELSPSLAPVEECYVPHQGLTAHQAKETEAQARQVMADKLPIPPLDPSQDPKAILAAVSISMPGLAALCQQEVI